MNFLDINPKHTQISNCMKILLVVAELSHADRRTDGQLIVAFHNFANAPKNQLLSTDGRFVLFISTFYRAAKVFFFLENGVSSYFIFHWKSLFQKWCLIFQICLEQIIAISVTVKWSTISHTLRCQQTITYQTSGIKFCWRYSTENKAKTCYT